MTTTAEKKRYEYQPKDDEGRNLGRPQVILYDTQEELIEKLTEQNKSVIKEMRNLKKNNRLGILEKENIPDTAPRFAPPVEFKPTELSVDDRIALARDLTDPLKMEAAFDRLTSAKFGAPVEKIREAITSTQQTMTDAQVRNEVSYFLQNTPDYYACKENFDTIYNWMVRYSRQLLKGQSSLYRPQRKLRTGRSKGSAHFSASTQDYRVRVPQVEEDHTWHSQQVTTSPTPFQPHTTRMARATASCAVRQRR
jgi:hypothetical protein